MFFPLICSHKDFLYLPLLQCIVVLSLCFFSKCLHGFVVFWVEAVTLLSLNCCQFGNSITWDSWILHTSHQSARQSVTGMYCFYLDGQTRRTIGGKIGFFFFFQCPSSVLSRLVNDKQSRHLVIAFIMKDLFIACQRLVFIAGEKKSLLNIFH